MLVIGIILSVAIYIQSQVYMKHSKHLSELMSAISVSDQYLDSLAETLLLHKNLKDITDDLTSEKPGKDYIILLFTPNDCVACMRELATLNHMVTDQQLDMNILGLCINATQSEFTTIMNMYRPRYPVAAISLKDLLPEHLYATPYRIYTDAEGSIILIKKIDTNADSINDINAWIELANQR